MAYGSPSYPLHVTGPWSPGKSFETLVSEASRIRDTPLSPRNGVECSAIPFAPRGVPEDLVRFVEHFEDRFEIVFQVDAARGCVSRQWAFEARA